MYIADLHIHSRYSRATSRDCTPEHLDLWARRKGIHLVGSGDFTHPAWREELKEKLEWDKNGFYVLKEEYRIHEDSAPDDQIPRFVITGEISSIYKQDGTQSDSASRSRTGGGDLPETGRNRKYPFRRQTDSWCELSRSVGDDSGNLPGGDLCAGSYLDAALFHVWRLLRF